MTVLLLCQVSLPNNCSYTFWIKSYFSPTVCRRPGGDVSGFEEVPQVRCFCYTLIFSIGLNLFPFYFSTSSISNVLYALYSKPTAEVLTEYSRKVDFLKGLLEAEKLVSVCGHINLFCPHPTLPPPLFLFFFLFCHKLKSLTHKKMKLYSNYLHVFNFFLFFVSLLVCCFFLLFSLQKQKRLWPTSSWHLGEHPR